MIRYFFSEAHIATLNFVDEEGLTPIYYLFQRPDLFMEIFKDTGDEYYSTLVGLDEDEDTTAHLAAEIGNTKLLEFLTEKFPAILIETDSQGNNFFQDAIYNPRASSSLDTFITLFQWFKTSKALSGSHFKTPWDGVMLSLKEAIIANPYRDNETLIHTLLEDQFYPYIPEVFRDDHNTISKAKNHH